MAFVVLAVMAVVEAEVDAVAVVMYVTIVHRVQLLPGSLFQTLSLLAGNFPIPNFP